MNGQLQKVSEMIKKTFHSQEQNDCFDGCTLYIEENCNDKQTACLNIVNKKLDSIESKIDNLRKDLGYQYEK
jgi:hypothetical protein